MSVTYPLGFRAGGIQAGLRTTPGLDLALIVNDGPADVVAGVFTTNRVCAAPVQWSRHATADHKARAVIVNAAVANACTGIDGFADCDITFSRVDSDACMSTNDTVVAMASGASGISLTGDELTDALTELCAILARQLVADAEGSHHDVKVTVTGATSTEAAVAVAREVTRSNLVKTAIAGNDPNWGRILAAIGCVPENVAPFDPDQVDVSINDIQICKAGGIGEDRNLVDMRPREVHIDIELHAGDAEAAVWTNDLTHQYVEENSAYTS